MVFVYFRTVLIDGLIVNRFEGLPLAGAFRVVEIHVFYSGPPLRVGNVGVCLDLAVCAHVL